MKRIRGLLRLTLLLPLLAPTTVFASIPSTGVKIVEVQTTGINGATDEEFIEIYNTSNSKIDLSTWKLQYLSAGGSSWQTKATLNGFIYPKGKLLLTSSGYMDDIADITFSSGMKMEAGHARIAKPDPNDDTKLISEDLVGWGTALHPEGEAADYAPAGSSITRKTNSVDEYVDTDNNKSDFGIDNNPIAESNNISPDDETINGEEDDIVEENIENIIPVEDEVIEEIIETVEILTEDVSNEGLQPVQITELLPNPAPPASDSTDEYIELYNPNNEDFDLTGYKLQTGNSFSYSYTFDDKIIDGGSYLTLYISETGLTLANSSGQARLLSPTGTVLFQTDKYNDAKDGEAWTYKDGVWQWTGQPTPGSENVLAATTAELKAAEKAKKTTKSTTPKAKKATTAKKTAQKKSGTAATTTNNGDADSGGTTSINRWIIAGVGAIALGYALYEYKDDIRNKFLQFRRNRAIGRSAGEPT
ncbi:lamin tail domain-containing protein [Candidatus Saccharibacteria bacterium]|nr:lamin tail domain-containing protein [Candidatus Saccharibacteria bacterium]